MLQKFALAFKTKTIEFFAEDEDDDDDDRISTVDFDPPASEEVITGQRVVVLKPDSHPRPDPDILIPSLFSAVSSFRAAYLRLQAAHAPLDPDAAGTADSAAVSHLRRLSDLKHSFLPNPNPDPMPPLSSFLEAQVRENQSLLRAFETSVGRLQSDIDRKEAEASALKLQLQDIEAAVSKLERRLDRASSPPDEKVEAFLTVGVFDSVLRDSCRGMHRFAKILMDAMKKSKWDLVSAANSIHPGVNYAKPGHCRYAILSYICLIMLEGFDSFNYSLEELGGIGCSSDDSRLRTKNSLRQFIEHSAVDVFELMESSPDCAFAKFCKTKYDKLFPSSIESSVFGNSECVNLLRGSLQPWSPLYEPFVSMASSVWMLHKLAWAYDPVVEIFQVGRGNEFSAVYMESVVRNGSLKGLECRKVSRAKVGFTVVPGFRVGRTAIQCRVYVEGFM